MGWAHQSRVEAAAASLESATAAFVAYLDALPDAAAIQPLPGGWTASRHAAHLALTNDVFIGVINGGGPLSAFAGVSDATTICGGRKPGGNQARTNVTAAGIIGAVQPLAAVKDFTALFAHRGERSLHLFHSLGVNQRPHERRRLQGIANAHLFVSTDQPAGQFLPH